MSMSIMFTAILIPALAATGNSEEEAEVLFNLSELAVWNLSRFKLERVSSSI
jgi:hypothetical protein